MPQTTEQPMTADLVEFGLIEALSNITPGSGYLPDVIRWVSTFKAAGVLTRDSGFVLTMIDGTEFQVSIVKSK